MDTKIEAPTLEVMIRRWQGAERVVRREQRVAMNRATLPIQQLAQELAPWDMGHLRRSIATRIRQLADGVEGITGTNVPYGEVQERGRRVGSMPPEGALLGWMRRHGIPEDAEYVIRRGIARKGTKPQPYLIPAFERNKAHARQELGPALARRIMLELSGGRAR